MVTTPFGVLFGAAAFGKTVVAARLIAERQTNTLFSGIGYYFNEC